MSTNRSADAPTYEQFKTGLTYRDVYCMIWSRPWKRRHGVLGKWREIKRAMYAQLLAECALYGGPR